MLKKFKNDEFTKNGMIMFISGLSAGIFNYLYQIYMGGKLRPDAYGEFGALFAIFYIISVFSNTISTSTANFVSKFFSEGKHIGFFVKGALKNLTILGLIFTTFFLIVSQRLLDILKISDYKPIVVLLLIIFLTFISPILEGSLRGIKKFYVLGISGVLNALFKLIFGILLVVLGYGVAGALLGVFIGMFLASIINIIFLKSDLKLKLSDLRLKSLKLKHHHDSEFSISTFYGYSLPVIFTMLSISVPGNLDVIMVKSFFSAFDTGIYTSVSVLGKIIFFIPGAIYAVMFPSIVEKKVKGEDTVGILKKSLFYTIFLTGGIVLIYYLFPDTTIKIFGSQYIGAIPLIAPYGIMMFLFSLNVILVHYFLAMKKLISIIMFLLLTIMEIILLFEYHSSLLQMIYILLIMNLIYSIYYIPSVLLRYNNKIE